MNRSDSVKEIAPAFLAAQAKMKAAPKDANNPHFGSRYSDFASVVDAVRGPLHEAGIFFIQPVRLTEQGVEIETVLMHQSGEFFADTLAIPLGNRRDAQAVGSAISYGKRYALQSICGLPSDDDDGNSASDSKRDAQQPRQQQQPRASQNRTTGDVPKASAEQVSELKGLLATVKLADGKVNEWLSKAGVQRFEDMKAATIAGIIKLVKKEQQQPAAAA